MAVQKKVKIFNLFARAFREFQKNDPLRLAGATAFFATFALPAVLLILIQVYGLVLSPRFMTRQLFQNLGELVGRNTAQELRKTLFNVSHLFRHWYQAIFGFLFLIFVATTLLKVIKDSLNQLWSIRMEENLGIKFSLRNRFKSFLVILIAGILFLIVLLTEGGMDMIQHSTNNSSLEHGMLARIILNQLISFALVTIWFSLIFKFLPDGRPSWKTVLVGAAFTGILFTLGKLLLKWVLSYKRSMVHPRLPYYCCYLFSTLLLFFTMALVLPGFGPNCIINPFSLQNMQRSMSGGN
jgi:membrane protein